MENDLISRSALKKALLDRGFYPAIVKAALENAPAVDAVEVTHCRECKHWIDGFAGCTEHIKACEYGGYMVGGNGYCVYGERMANRG